MSCQDKQLKSDSAKHIDAEILANHKKKEREAAKQGKRPFYLKKCNASFHLSFPSLSMQPFRLVLDVRNAISVNIISFCGLCYKGS